MSTHRINFYEAISNAYSYSSYCMSFRLNDRFTNDSEDEQHSMNKKQKHTKTFFACTFSSRKVFYQGEHVRLANDNRVIKHNFPFINVRKVLLRELLKPRTKHEVCNISRGTFLRMLMTDKIDRYHIVKNQQNHFKIKKTKQMLAHFIL